MQVFDTKTATPSAAYIRIENTIRPFVKFGRVETGGLSGETWADLLAWLIKARHEVEFEMRDRTDHAGVCTGGTTPGEPHTWTLVESGCERTWTSVELELADDDEGRAGGDRVAAVATAGSEEAPSDGETYYLQCRYCQAEANVDDVDFA
jgi:hypothetical protein